MTGNKYLLDSNIVIEIFDGNKAIADKINTLSTFYIPAIILGELYVGINRVTNKAKHLKMLNNFLALSTILDISSKTAKFYGEITATLFKKGRPIPTNDIWIAAVAHEHSLTVITRDDHFKEIEGIKLEKW